jgi:hypothetical protein
MSIPKYKKDDIIKAYIKQSRLKFRLDTNSVLSVGQCTDMVTLSSKEDTVIPSSSDSVSFPEKGTMQK